MRPVVSAANQGGVGSAPSSVAEHSVEKVEKNNPRARIWIFIEEVVAPPSTPLQGAVFSCCEYTAASDYVTFQSVC